MKKNAFTLVELLVVVIIIALTAVLVITKVEKNIKRAKELEKQTQIEAIESAAYIYANDYGKELSHLESIGVDKVRLEVLVNKMLLNKKNLEGIDLTNEVVIAKIEGNIKTYYDYDQKSANVIFLLGLKETTVRKESTYVDSGAYVAVMDVGVEKLSSTNMTSNVDTSKPGVYEVKYNYTNAEEVIRKVTVTKKENSIKQVTLTVNLNGGVTTQTFESKYISGTKITLIAPTKENSKFKEWTVTGTGSKIEGNVLTIGNEDVTLTANYEVEEYTLTVNLNGGNLSQTLKSKYKVGEKVTLSIPTKTGYMFTEWTVTGNGSKVENNIFTMGSANTTLTANYTSSIAVNYITNLYNDDTLREKNGLIKDDTEDNNIRYSGSNPNNYVKINDEIWRIIGLFSTISQESSENPKVRLKLIRNEEYYGDNGITSWALDESTGNSWTDSDLMNELNSTYYETSVINYMIDPVEWNIGGFNDLMNFGDVYLAEKAETWYGNVGLLNVSDFAYASKSNCVINVEAGYGGACAEQNWIYSSVGNSSSPRNTINRYSLDNLNVWFYDSTAMLIYATVTESCPILPVVYLNPAVYITGGTGAEDNPYILAL